MSLRAQSGAGPFSSLLHDLIDRGPDPGLRVSKEEGGVWIHVEPKDAEIPPRGWKLHVSAIPSSASEVLTRVVPLLAAEAVAFKLAATEQDLYEINQGAGGRSQVGKFITVYPRDEDQAVRLAVALDHATAGLRGPRVPSDKALSPSSLVHYRYGDFVMETVVEGSPRRDPEPTAPDPFEAAGAVAASEQRLIAGRYLITSTLHRSVRGAIHLAVEVTKARTCVLKRAWRDACAMPDGRDARDRLREEADLMRRLGPDPHFPEVWDVVEHEGDLFAAMEYFSGPTLAAAVHEGKDGGRALPDEEITRIGVELARALGRMHSLGYVHRDLSPANVLLRRDGNVSLVDFELALPIGSSTEDFAAGTPGYMSPEQEAAAPAAVSDDVFGLGALLHLAATGTDPGPDAPEPHEVAPGLAAIIARCLDADPAARWDSMESLRNALDR